MTNNLLSTGSTLLNLAISGNPHGGFRPGYYYFLVGDSMSGKTWFSISCCAEASLDKNFEDYRFIFDNKEEGALMDFDRFFGEAMADRIEPPATDTDGNPLYSETLEAFYFNLDDAVKDGRPFIYILDSMDAIEPEGVQKRFAQHKKAFKKRRGDEAETTDKEEKVSGSMGMEKAKLNSEGIRKIIDGLKATQSILIIISQTRDSLYGKTRAGGRALRFYATAEIWTSVAAPIKKTVLDKDREIGKTIELRTAKNRITGKLYTVTTDIYPSYGIDDLGSCIDFLVKEKFWTQTKLTITAKGLDLVGTREKIIKLIEKNGLERELRELCGQCWKEIDEACSLKRKARYQNADK